MWLVYSVADLVGEHYDILTNSSRNAGPTVVQMSWRLGDLNGGACNFSLITF